MYLGSVLTSGHNNSLRDVAGEPLPTACTKSWNDVRAPATGSFGHGIAPRIWETKSGSSAGSLESVGTTSRKGSMGRPAWLQCSSSA